MISRSKKITDTDKKLLALKTQLYGKEVKGDQSNSSSFNFKTLNNQQIPQNYTSTVTPTYNYLKHDLLKITLLATVAVSAQIILYFVLNRNY